MSNAELKPDWVVHPGQVLAAKLSQLGLRQSELAERTGLSPKHVNQIVKHLVGISPDVAILLERALGVPAAFWNRAEADYQAFVSRRRADEALGSYRQWAAQFHTGTLIRHGIIKRGDTGTTKAEKLLKFFQVANPDAFDQTWMRPSVSFRRSQAFTVNQPNTALWLRLVERSAQNLRVEPFNPKVLRKTARSLAAITTMAVANGFIAARAALAEAGVALTFVREIPDTRVFAATWWIDGDRPAIGITERCKRPDIFWFNLIHEVGHVTLHARRESFLDLDTEQRLADPAEAEADSFAVETLFPGGTSDQIARASSQHELIILASRLGLGVPTVAGCYAKRTDNWKLVSALRGTISDDDIAALEAAVNDNSGGSEP